MNLDTHVLGIYMSRSLVPFIVFDSMGIPEHWNPAAERILKRLLPEGISPRDHSVHEYVQQYCTAEEAIRIEYLVAQGIPHFTFELHIPGADNNFTWLKFIVSLQDNGTWFAIIDDITQQKIKERHLVTAKEDAEKASTTRSQFLANISHEIRTPIQTIIGMMELLSDTKLDEEQQEYNRQVKFSADVLLTLINDILDLSKGEAGLLKIEQIEYDPVECIEKTVDLVSMEAHRKGLELVVDIDPKVPAALIGDPGRVRQVVLNLVKNAVKFTANGMVQVAVTIEKAPAAAEAGQEHHEVLKVEVADTGIGISFEARAKLFTLFYQADSSTSRQFGGTGLGLAISKNIVTLMHGDIGMRTHESSGSVFWFQIPLLRPAVSMESVPRPGRPGMRILLVDDNEYTLRALARTFSYFGYTNVSQATSGNFALAMLHAAERSHHPFDLAFIDMVMPEMDGWRLAAEINNNRAINQVQLYLMVPEGGFGVDAKMKLLEWFNGYLYKPVKRRMLSQLLSEQLQNSIDLEVVEDLKPVEEAEEAAATPAVTKVESAPVKPAFSGFPVLVAEDHPVNQKLIRIFLEKEGALVSTANDGMEALEAAARVDFGLVFMDIQMPKLNGYLATRELRARGYLGPVIACTASAQENEREQCLLYGMDDILAKPFRRQDVLSILSKWKNHRRPETPMLENTENNPILDFELLTEILMGDTETARSLLAEFMSQTREHVALIGSDIAALEREAVRQTAHLIKGSALNVTARALAAKALELEEAAPKAEPAVLMKIKESIEAAFSKLETEVSKL